MACLHEKELWDNRWCPVTCFYCTGDQKRRCKHNKETNADKLRNMDETAFVRFLDDVTWSALDSEGDLSKLKYPPDTMTWREWLQSPAEKEGE